MVKTFAVLLARAVADRACGIGRALGADVTHQGGATLCSSARKSERQPACALEFGKRFACIKTLLMAIWIDKVPTEM